LGLVKKNINDYSLQINSQFKL